MSRHRPAWGQGNTGWHAALMLAVALGASGVTQAETKQTCWREGPSQFADAMHYCVSSVLQPQGASTYGPRNLVGYYGSSGAWCEGARGSGVGETITVRIDRGPAFRRLQIRNGYGRTPKSFSDNGRIKLARITSDTGIDTTLQLVDQPGWQPLYLPIIAAHRWVRLEIIDVYPGARFSDACVSAIAPDFEYEEELSQREQASPAPTPPAPVQTLPRGEVSPPQSPASGTSEGFEELPALPGSEPGSAQVSQPEVGGCLSSGEVVSGRLELHKATHLAGYPMKSFHLVLTLPICVIANGERTDGVRQVQLAPSQEQSSELSSRLGKIIAVSGTFVLPHTAWHTGDIVLTDVNVD